MEIKTNILHVAFGTEFCKIGPADEDGQWLQKMGFLLGKTTFPSNATQLQLQKPFPRFIKILI